MEASKCLQDVDEKSLTLVDVTCPICLSIMIQPITMPCHHSLCHPCFELNVSQSKIACPLCRKRISIWVRKVTKYKKLINEDLWQKIQSKFKDEVAARLNGKDDENNSFTYTLPPVKVAEPGEIREEYEEQVRRLREEEEASRLQEEAASISVIQTLQENEEKEFNGLIHQRELLSEKDFEFAKQLRSSQINEKLNTMKSHKKNGVTNSTKKGTVGSSNSPSAAPIDFYLEHFTPKTKDRAELKAKDQRTPVTPPSSHQKCSFLRKIGDNENRSNNSNSEVKRSLQTELGREVRDSELPPTTSTPTSEAASCSSSRIFKDITAHYSSESEPEFDSEENIPRIEDVANKEFMKAKNKCNFPYNKGVKNPVKSDILTPPNPEEAADNTPLSLLSEAFDENIQNKEYLLQLIEEQKLLEQKIEQEKQDRRLALQLQKSFKEVDRSKGSKDEYSLRNKKKNFKKSNSGSLQSRRTPDSSKKNKLRQTTLMESLSKKQRRV